MNQVFVGTLEQKYPVELLSRELSHRVTNELISAISVISERRRLLGMIVSELITNAARHAFQGSTGSILVELLPSGTSVECRVTDNGTSDADIRPGQGLKIINALTENLQGTLDQQFGPLGARSVLIFPLNP